MPEFTHNQAHPNGEPAAHTPEHGFWWKTWLALKVVQARLRFIALLAVVGAILAPQPPEIQGKSDGV